MGFEPWLEDSMFLDSAVFKEINHSKKDCKEM